jgi:hypothetical protein
MAALSLAEANAINEAALDSSPADPMADPRPGCLANGETLPQAPME